MKIGKEDLFRINKGFGGHLRSSSSLDYALEKADNRRLGMYKKLAYLFRAILVDHPFSDANKRTAMFLAYSFAEDHKKHVNEDVLMHQVFSIAKKNINDIRKIERRLKTAII